MASGALDRPGPKAFVITRELDKLVIALRCRLDGDLAEHPTGVRINRCRAVGSYVGVDADHDVDDFGQTVHALLLCLEGRGRFPVRTEKGRTVTGHVTGGHRRRSSS